MRLAVHPRRVFIDTSAYFSLVNQRDAQHAFAVSVAARLIHDQYRLFTSNYIVAETHALLLRRMGRDVAFRALVDLDRSNTTIIRVSSGDERRAREILERFEDKEFSLTDATSFVIMERLRIGQAFTLDDHFSQYGFQRADLT